ncbi:TetR family transcriptional regulator [Bacillus massiliigorillae]|uniref:TetR family transcriptional regulator n=1 Tax=Bacillus massiliigorillae TaxID=1243664 RepID=UPI0003A04DA0|nr:TetR family transcriptional regulator [Bacillus massiliigorillae]
MRNKILETSIELFDIKGYKETSVQDIVDVIGVTKGTFYYYFTSKQDIIENIALSYIEEILSKQEAIISDTSKDCTTKLRDIVYMLISDIKTNRRSARIFFREMRNIEEGNFLNIKSKRSLFKKHYQQLIEEGIKTGEFKESLNADMITFGILGITNWSYYWFNPEGEISESDLTDIYVDMIFNGIKN